ncbi:MAG: esterase family protein [Thermodesulfobacteriota bacterium]
MNIEYHKWYSSQLNQDMELKVYGRQGKPVIVFPSSGGRFFDYEDNGMVAACGPFIDSGKFILFAVDSVDHQSWLNQDIYPQERVLRHEAYERYILHEVVPFIFHHVHRFDKIMTTGCSMGAYHAANFLFRHPETFDSVIALSGLYGPDYLFDGYRDDRIYYHFPLLYLPGLHSHDHLEALRRCRIILCVGQGPWETCDQYDCIGETRALKQILQSKDIPCWADFWGHDVEHDWSWWRVQMPYFLGRLDR